MYKMIDTIFTTGQRILDDLRTTQADICTKQLN